MHTSSRLSALKSRGSDALEKLKTQIKEANETRARDERFWNPTRGKDGNGYALIRFLPAGLADGEDAAPYVKIWDHGFNGPGGWYIEKSLTTIGLDDPVAEYNSKLWNSGSEANKEKARKQKRRLKFVSNVLVIEDSANPANNGKVFLYAYGKKIFEKINDAMFPKFKNETQVFAFDFWKGADFHLKITTKDKFPNYDKCEFGEVTPLGDDQRIEAIWEQCYSLKELLDPKNYKTYDALKIKLDKVLGLSDGPSAETRSKSGARRDESSGDEPAQFDDSDPPFDQDDEPEQKTQPRQRASAPEKDEDPIDFFKRLAAQK